MCICLCRKKAEELKRANSSDSTVHDGNTSSELSSSMTQMTSMPTYMRSDFELSLPGFLCFEAGPSFRQRKEIASGGGGTVFIGDAFISQLTAYGPQVIIKVINNCSHIDQLPERLLRSFEQEISIMYFFREHKNIAKLLGWSKSPVCIVMKFYAFGSLETCIMKKEMLKSKTIQLQTIQDISCRIMAMHSAGFAHCDLKPANVLVDYDGTRLFCALTDFGITQIVDDKTLTVKDFRVSDVKGLTVGYAAPEALKRLRAHILKNVPGDLR